MNRMKNPQVFSQAGPRPSAKMPDSGNADYRFGNGCASGQNYHREQIAACLNANPRSRRFTG